MKKIGILIMLFISITCYGQENLYEKIGNAHNETMAKVYVTAKEAESQGKGKEEILSMCYETYLVVMSEQAEVSKENVESTLSEMGLTTGFQDINITTLANEKISEIAQTNEEYANKLSQILETANSVNNYSELNTALNKIENSSKDKEYENVILTVCSITRSSYQYWYDENNIWVTNGNTQGKHEGVVGADISSAIIGGTWGAISGSFAGGIGALPGGLLGGMIGASYGSALAGVREYMGWW